MASRVTHRASGHPLSRRTLFPAPVNQRYLRVVRNTIAGEVTPASLQDPNLQKLLSRFDSDGDGRLTFAEVQQAFGAMQLQELHSPTGSTTAPPPSPHAAASALSTTAAATPPTAPCPATWDLQVLQGIRAARSRGQSSAAALLSYMGGKLRNTGKARASASDLVWSFCGMFLAVLALGIMNMHVRNWPVVGEWHQQGLGLLLGSFGTLCVLIFGRPEAEAVRIWNLLAGHVIATATVLTLLHVIGPCVFSRALAMASMIAAMLFTDSVHPPGGALVLMAVDSAAIQQMDWWFMLYPSLAVTIALLLPLGVAINWLKRNVKFDFPAASAPSSSSSSSSSAATWPTNFTPPQTPPPELRPKMA